MNSVATKIVRRAYATLKADPEHDWAADLVEIGEMLKDRERELAALHRQLGVAVMTVPVRPLSAG